MKLGMFTTCLPTLQHDTAQRSILAQRQQFQDCGVLGI
jgi:hypothetical protein